MDWFISVVVTNKRSMGILLRRSLLWRRKLLAACLSPPVWLDMIIDDGSRTCASPAFGGLLAGRLPYTLHRARWVLPLPLGPSSSFIYSARRGAASSTSLLLRGGGTAFLFGRSMCAARLFLVLPSSRTFAPKVGTTEGRGSTTKTRGEESSNALK